MDPFHLQLNLINSIRTPLPCKANLSGLGPFLMVRGIPFLTVGLMVSVGRTKKKPRDVLVHVPLFTSTSTKPWFWPCRRLGILGRLGTSAGGALSLGERALAEDEDAHAVSDKLN